MNEDISESLAKLFIENVVLSFGMLAVVVVDVDRIFLHICQNMCAALAIKLWPLSRSNHKGLRIEIYHRFLNKTQTFVGQNQGTHYYFIENTKTSQYTWNSAPIENTNNPCFVTAI